MNLFNKKPKCVFCEGIKGLFHSVHAYGIYGAIGKRLHYHPECLEMVEIDPEKFGHIMVDKAIYINDLKNENVRKNNSRMKKEFKEKVEKLHQRHFERMMPRKA